MKAQGRISLIEYYLCISAFWKFPYTIDKKRVPSIVSDQVLNIYIYIATYPSACWSLLPTHSLHIYISCLSTITTNFHTIRIKKIRFAKLKIIKRRMFKRENCQTEFKLFLTHNLAHVLDPKNYSNFQKLSYI